ncbi:MAG: nucleotidyltransferase domain-containing protein [candidate division WOR-3 bacterium]
MTVRVVKEIKKILAEDKSIKFAYLFGSFTEGENYNDIDIGIYIVPLVEKNLFKTTSDLKCKISKVLVKKGFNIKPDNVDIVVLNLVSFTFLNRVFKTGTLIFDRDYDLRTDLIEKNAIAYRGCIGILKETSIL